MARSQYYPPADRTTQWFGPGNAIVAPNKVLWHTTETAGGWPGYNGGLAAPNLTYDPWKHQWRQHFPLNATSRALANGPAYSTNRQGTVQIELSCTNGWSKDAVAAGRAVWMFDKQAIQDLADFSRFMFVEWGVPLTDSGVAWPSYPIAPARLSPGAFTAHRGHLGHMHAPFNDHGDPGGLATSRFLAIARDNLNQPPGEDLDMNEQEVKNIVDDRLKSFFVHGGNLPDGEGFSRIIQAVNESLKQSGLTKPTAAASAAPGAPEAQMAPEAPVEEQCPPEGVEHP